MPSGMVGVALAVILVVVWLIRRVRGGRRRSGIGSGAIGAVYDLLNEDKRRAVELIVEQRAEARRPEYPDGNLPDLEPPAPPRAQS